MYLSRKSATLYGDDDEVLAGAINDAEYAEEKETVLKQLKTTRTSQSKYSHCIHAVFTYHFMLLL